MKYVLSFFLAHFLLSSTTAQVTLTESNLPIIVINTFGEYIPNDPKIAAQMGIINNETGQINHVGDAYEYTGWIGIEMRGSSSLWVGPKAPYSIETRTAAGIDMDTSLLGMPKESDWALIAPYSDKTLMRDILTYEWGGAMMAWAPRTRACELLINGEYLGVYVLTEKIKRDNDRVDIDKLDPLATSGDEITGGYIIKIDKCSGETGCEGWTSPYLANPTTGSSSNFIFHYPKAADMNPAQKGYIQNYVTEFEEALSSQNFDDWNAGYYPFVDLQSFADFLLINEITRNVDGYRLSSYFYKEADSDGSKLHMGPVWDFNIALGNADYCEGQNTDGWAYAFNSVCPDGFQIPFWWQRMLQDDAFKSVVRARWEEMRSTIWSDAALTARIEALRNQLGVPASRNFTKWPIQGQYVWPNPFVGNTFDEDVDYLKEWLTDRVIWLDGQFSNFPVSFDTIKPRATLPYPNPSADGVFHFYQPNHQYFTLDIFDFSGKLLFTQEVRGKLDWTAPDAGTFIYRIKVLYNDPQTGLLRSK